jgi:hypothetical protein
MVWFSHPFSGGSLSGITRGYPNAGMFPSGRTLISLGSYLFIFIRVNPDPLVYKNRKVTADARG